MTSGVTNAARSTSGRTQTQAVNALRTVTIWRTDSADSKDHYEDLPAKTITYEVNDGKVVSCRPSCFLFAAEHIEAKGVLPGENFTTECKSMGLTMHFYLDDR